MYSNFYMMPTNAKTSMIIYHYLLPIEPNENQQRSIKQRYTIKKMKKKKFFFTNWGKKIHQNDEGTILKMMKIPL